MEEDLMKKRLIVAALAIAGAMSLSGCGGSKSNTEPAADSTKAAENGDTLFSSSNSSITLLND